MERNSGEQWRSSENVLHVSAHGDGTFGEDLDVLWKVLDHPSGMERAIKPNEII